MSPRYLFLAGGHVLIHARPNINHAKLRRYKRRKLEKSQVCSKHYHHFPLKYSRLIITPEVQIGHHHRFCIVLQDLTPLNNITSPGRLEMTPSCGRRQIMPYQNPSRKVQNQELNFRKFLTRPYLFGLKKVSYNGRDVLFSPYNEYWREMRKIVTVHLFSSKRIQSFRSIREEEVFQMIKGISEKGSSNEVLNLSDTLAPLTIAMTSRLAFGKKFNEVDMKRFKGLLKRFQDVTAAFYFSDIFPSLQWLDRFTGSSAELDGCFRDMDSFYQEVIDEHLDPCRPSSMDGDVIDILLQLKRDDQISSIDFTFDNIKAIIMNIFFAGTDTTANTLLWIMTSLIKNPEVMHKAQEEVRKLMHGKERIEEEDLQNVKLPYLEAVIKETMRMYPVAPLIPRESLDRMVVNGYEILPKTIVYVNLVAIGRDPLVWENAEEFFPDRFLDTDIQFKGHDFEFIPFGTGRRICAGMYMAVATLELVLSNLLYSFDWELPPGIRKEDIDTDIGRGITLHKKNALCLKPRIFF
ncbi:5-OH-xanthotoxin synthase isoform X2 [Daucus carota subsp. sativus]|uniref:5-OH-xanthotoxin synthase isoform X2 n=1 Tax=Daucus carota subsp. sativus TaxID=79200 RepID=UPI0007EFD461|nr:PREDICTED: cytochrome P450 71A1-like isoform X2 [Daucus carota subsp. sativus]